MHHLDEKHWRYYFSFRKPDYICITLLIPLSEWDVYTLARFLREYLAAGGEAEIVFPEVKQVDWLKRSIDHTLLALERLKMNTQTHANIILTRT